MKRALGREHLSGRLVFFILGFVGLGGGCHPMTVDYVDGFRHITTQLKTSSTGLVSWELQIEDEETALLATATPANDYDLHLARFSVPSDQEVFWAEDAADGVKLSNAAFVASPVTFNWPILSVHGPISGQTIAFEWGVVNDDLYYVPKQWIDVEILLKEDPIFEAGTLKVEIVYTETVSQDSVMVAGTEEAVEAWRILYEQAGIDLYVTYSTADAGILEPPSIGSGPFYESLSASTGYDTIPVVIASEINFVSDVFGIAGDVPGPLVPTSRSSVLISSVMAAGPDGVFSEGELQLYSETLAHEVAHFLGLFHPVEITLDAWDGLDDTSMCVTEASCIADLGNNLMFPYPICDFNGCLPQNELTEAQGGVINRFVGVD